MKKRKIAILTLPLHSNYGGLLQAYALQKALISLGHETLLINNDVSNYPNWRKRISFAKQKVFQLIMGGAVIRPDLTSKRNKKIIGQHSAKFVARYIHKTNLVPAIFNFEDVKAYNFEGYVVGSDQVWRPNYTPSILNYFYDFLEPISSIKKISYAASFGVDHWQYSLQETENCARLAKMFNAISVREDSGISLCQKKLGVDAVRVLDPTLLINKRDYEDLVEKAQLTKPKGRLFTYILDRSVDNIDMEEKAAKYLNTNHYTAMPRKDMQNLSAENINEFIFPPVEEWINGFMSADYIITDSFHGTLFSIIFNKKFISIGNKRRGLSRFTSILKQLGLENRLLLDVSDFSPELLNEDIDWDSVNIKLEVERKESIEFLKNNL
ncbi:polysaccharide pyruvyl transferase family protein [uncultured Maribacter sp.]|uniref:polysaccharide pyruvyl transferase family protein n=1 Tax=uncultured Maribacter sp. TaxID=431308 RepID=UPI0030D91DFF|tara:strand:+ start:81 stop:1226 length:1146 start_codon:yes stop_codon:yes gene_type:complete